MVISEPNAEVIVRRAPYKRESGGPDVSHGRHIASEVGVRQLELRFAQTVGRAATEPQVAAEDIFIQVDVHGRSGHSSSEFIHDFHGINQSGSLQRVRDGLHQHLCRSRCRSYRDGRGAACGVSPGIRYRRGDGVVPAGQRSRKAASGADLSISTRSPDNG